MISCIYRNRSYILKGNDTSIYNLIENLLEVYHSSNNKLERAKIKTIIVTKMIPVVKHIAKVIARRSSDPVEDMIQAGCIGVLKAIDSYSSDKDSNFRTYAGYLIIGEMKHYLRDRLSAIRVPRYIQELSYRINNFTKALTAEELNELTNEDVASALKISAKNVDAAMQADRRGTIFSFEDIYRSDQDNRPYEEVISSEDYQDTSEINDAKIILTEVIKKLPPEPKKIIGMYYFKDMNQKEIAKELNLSQMQVSRRMKKAFSMIYKMIAELESMPESKNE